MKSLFTSIIFAVSVAFNTSTTAASWTFSADGQTITGISGVEVYSGVFYDAEFNDSAWTLDRGYGQAFSLAASIAIVDELNNGDLFNTFSDLNHDTRIVGFESLANTSQYSDGWFITPHEVTHGLMRGTNQYTFINGYTRAVNQQRINPAIVETDYYVDRPSEGLTRYADSDIPNYTYLDWKLADSSISAVPIPTAAWLFLPALFGFIGLRKKAKSA